jgi:cytoskeleton-associated protein 5
VTTLEKVRASLPPKTAAAKPVAAAAASSEPVAKSTAAPSKPAAVTKQATKVEEDVEEKTPAAGAKKVVGKGGAAAANKAGGAKKDDKDKEDTSAPLVASATAKEQRFKDEKARKILKWNFTAPTQEFVDQLQQQMTAANVGKSFAEMLFHSDFKFHLRALDILMKECESSLDATVSNLDLILKWHTLHFFDTNTSVLLKQLEHLHAVFMRLPDVEYHLNELEASAFLPYLINKVNN